MYRIYICLTTLLLIFTASANSQNSIIINGYVAKTITDKFGNSELSIRIKKTTNSVSEGQLLTIPIAADGKFKAVLNPAEETVYISFEMSDSKNKGNYYNLSDPNWKPLKHVYLLEVGDVINVVIGNNGNLKFTGKGSDKLNCQWQLLHQDMLLQSEAIRIVELSANDEVKQQLYFKDKLFSLAIAAKEELLLTYKTALSPKIYQQLYLDAVANAEFEMIGSLSRSASTFKNQKNLSIVQEYYNYYLATSRFLKFSANENELEQSAYAAELLFEQMLTAATIYQPAADLNERYVTSLYQKIITDYKGILRDKLFFIFFERMYFKYASTIRKNVDSAQEIMGEGVYKRLLNEWKIKKYQAFPFELMDVNGRLHKLSDYEGKLLVIDFWYTGCPNCIVLNEQMHPILTQYKNKKDVVFLTVSVDTDKEKWKKSISSKKYTSEQSINLYTNGLGLNNGIIRNYNFIAFPQQLIIGKEGELITTSPPRPSSATAIKQFIDLIADHL